MDNGADNESQPKRSRRVKGRITSVPVPLHSAFQDDKTTLIFGLETDSGTVTIFYLTDLDRNGDPPRLAVGQPVELTDPILNTHPAGAFYYATEGRLLPRRPGTQGFSKTPKALQDLYQRIFQHTKDAPWLAQGWHDAAALVRTALPGCTESSSHNFQKPSTAEWFNSLYRLDFAVHDDPRHSLSVDLGPTADHYRIIFMPHAVRVAAAALEAATAKITYEALDLDDTPPTHTAFPPQDGKEHTVEIALEFEDLDEAREHRHLVVEAAEQVHRGIGRRPNTDGP